MVSFGKLKNNVGCSCLDFLANAHMLVLGFYSSGQIPFLIMVLFRVECLVGRL